MKVFSFYNPETGLFTGQRFIGRETHLAINVPAGCEAVEGDHDHLSRRVDVERLARDKAAGQEHVIDYQPPPPSPDHEWHAESRRWKKRADVVERETRTVQTRAQIARLEAKQARALREAQLGIEPSEAERARGAMTIREIDQEIAELRKQL